MTVVDAVVPATRPPSLNRLYAALDGFPGRMHVVDGRGCSPAAARNAGWRRSRAEWVVFLDDDVVPRAGWVAELLRDLSAAGSTVAGSQGRVIVPLAPGRRPTDWERCVRGLESARWATADMAYRRDVLDEVGGFDERFARAYREDSDLALRVQRAGYALERGQRTVIHPVGPAGPLVSLRKQAGNADDVLMRIKHGRGWRAAAGAPRGRFARHAVTVAFGLGAVAALVSGHRRPGVAAGACWAAATSELALARIHAGPRTPGEIARMTATSAALPLAAVAASAAGWARYGPLALARRRTRAVLFDRDGTLVEDVPGNVDPGRLRLMPGARRAVARVRAAGLPIAVVTNQSVIGRGIATPEQVDALNRRVSELAGVIDEWLICPHTPDDACACRKPEPGLVVRAAARLGVTPQQCVLIGDIGSDVDAARAAGARAVLVPTSRTRPHEIEAAPAVAADLCSAVDLVLGGAV